LAVAAASAEAMLALGAETVKGTSMAAAACRRRPVTAAGASEMLTVHEAGKPWSRTSASCMMPMSAAPPGVPKKASGIASMTPLSHVRFSVTVLNSFLKPQKGCAGAGGAS
jgi:hypothetical protein